MYRVFRNIRKSDKIVIKFLGWNESFESFDFSYWLIEIDILIIGIVTHFFVIRVYDFFFFFLVFLSANTLPLKFLPMFLEHPIHI